MMKDELNSIDSTVKIDAGVNVDVALKKWNAGLMGVIEMDVPKVSVEPRHCSPSFDSEAQHHRNRERTAIRKAYISALSQ